VFGYVGEGMFQRRPRPVLEPVSMALHHPHVGDSAIERFCERSLVEEVSHTIRLKEIAHTQGLISHGKPRLELMESQRAW